MCAYSARLQWIEFPEPNTSWFLCYDCFMRYEYLSGQHLSILSTRTVSDYAKYATFFIFITVLLEGFLLSFYSNILSFDPYFMCFFGVVCWECYVLVWNDYTTYCFVVSSTCIVCFMAHCLRTRESVITQLFVEQTTVNSTCTIQ
jgi:hypothetical protein